MNSQLFRRKNTIFTALIFLNSKRTKENYTTMTITIKKVTTKKELKKFIRFNYELYKDNPYSVPDLYDDMLNTFNPKKNPAFEFCEAEYFLAYKGEEIVGRVAAIINHRANDTWNKKEVRFGWLDFIDEEEVSSALLKAVEQWGKEKGMEAIVGPLGFTDMDAEGMLVEGFDQLSTMATIYNYSYYPEHMEQLGFEKEADWVEYKLSVPHQLPDKFVRISEIILQKYNLKIKKLKRSEIKKQNYGQKIFDLINEAYALDIGRKIKAQARQDMKEGKYVGGRRCGRQPGGSGNRHAVLVESLAESQGKDASFRLVPPVKGPVHQASACARFAAGRREARIPEQGSQRSLVLRPCAYFPADGI